MSVAGAVVGVATVIAGVLPAWIASWWLLTQRRLRRILGPALYAQCTTATRRHRHRSPRNRILAGWGGLSLCAALFILAREWTREEPDVLWVLSALPLLTVGVVSSTLVRMPASMLVLGASNAEQLTLQASIRDSVFPFRPISLLQTGDLSVDGKIAGDCLRVSDAKDWRDTVFELCRDLPLIVIDLRILTPAVVTEIRHVVEADHLNKVLAVASADGERAVDEELRNAPGARGQPLIERNVGTALEFLRYLLLERETLPRRDWSLLELARDWKSWKHTDAAEAPSGTPVRVSRSGLTPFSYRPPRGWTVKEFESSDRYSALIRSRAVPGIWSYFRPRPRLDFIVLPYPKSSEEDEEKLRKTSRFKLAQHEAVITRERVGRRAGALSHELYFRQHAGFGYLIRFIHRGNEYVVRCYSMSGSALEQCLPMVERFVDEIELAPLPPGAL